MQNLPRNLLIALILLLPAQLIGEGFTIQSTVDTKFQGGLGAVAGFAARFSGRGLRNVATTTYLQGHKLRIDNPTMGTIYDLDAERVINIDHKEKTYSSMTFAEMSAAYERARASAEEARAKDAAKADPATPAKKDQLNVKYHVAVEQLPHPTNDMVPGYNAGHLYITITLEAEATSEGGKAEQVGNMVILLDQRNTKDAPLAPAYAEFYRLFSKKLGHEFRSQVQGMQAVFQADARMKDGFEAAAKELQKVQGIPLYSATHVVLVPPNTTFNRDLTLELAYEAQTTAVKEAEAEKSEKPKSKVGGFFGALKSAAVDVGKRMENANQRDNAPPKQSTLVVIQDKITSITTGAVPAVMFEPPAGYSEVKAKGL